jgi:hypothetical protein
MRAHPILAGALMLFACAKRGDAPRAYAAGEVPDSLAPAVRVADEGVELLKKRLVTRLQAELQRGGPAAAIDVCRSEALAITRAVAAERGVALGRTSHRLRNVSNTPPPWAAPHLAGLEGKKAEQVAPLVVDLGDRVGVLRPLATQELCLPCHGAREGLSAEVRAVLERSYPADQAVGFAVGDLRGFAWAEVPRAAR